MIRLIFAPILLAVLSGCDSTPVVLLDRAPDLRCPVHTKAVSSELRWGVMPQDRDAFERTNSGLATGLDSDDARKLVHLFAFVTCSNGATVVVRM